MTSLIQLGESSDGQFTYLNGLIPKTKGVTIYDYFNNTFVSLPKLLKKQKPGIECRMVIPTSSKTWRQDGVCIQYGFDKLYSRKEYTLSNYKENWLNDKLLFEYAASIDKNSKQARISKNNFFFGLRCRISVKCRLRILKKSVLQIRDFC